MANVAKQAGSETNAAPRADLRNGRMAYAAVAAFAVFLYGDLLVSRSGVVVSHVFGDVCSGLSSWRGVGFGEIAKGNLPLWNPYVFCGAPLAGNIQSALFYPINWLLYVPLPLAKAINADVFVHVLLLGWSTLAWVRTRGTGWLAGVLAAAIVMAAAPVCLRLNLGQPNVIAVFAWLPLTLMVMDRLLDRVSIGWLLTGIGAVAMQLLAGHPQTVYINGLTAGLYGALRLARHPHRVRTVLAWAVIAIAPLPIAAVQLAAAYHTMRESLRGGGTSLEFAASWSLPVENFLTAFAPFFYGDYVHVNYWARWCLWDVCVFIGIGSLFLLGYGAAYAPRGARTFAGTMLVVLVVVAMGNATPLFGALYQIVPGISYFRAPSRFLLPAVLFAAMLAGLGADEFQKRPLRVARFAAGAAVFGGCLLALGLALQWSPSILDRPNGLWTELVRSVESSGDAYWWYPMNDAAMANSVWIASVSALVAAATCVAVAFLFAGAGRRGYRVALVCFSAIEVLCFSRYARVTTDLDALTIADLVRLRETDRSDFRELNAKSFNPNWPRNYPAAIGTKTVWGYDPVMLERYAKFFGFALGGKAHERYLVYDVEQTNIGDPITMSILKRILKIEIAPRADGPFPWVSLPPLLRLTRCKYVYFCPEPDTAILGGVEGIHEVSSPFPRLSIYRDYRVVPEAGRVPGEMAAPGVDLTKTVFLEEEPSPKPASGGAQEGERIEVIDESTDHVSIDVHVASPGILFITDAYSTGWKASALPGSAQDEYRVLPADYAFQAVPLGAGHHRVRLEYAPALVDAGRTVSLASGAGFAIACAVAAWLRLRTRARAA